MKTVNYRLYKLMYNNSNKAAFWKSARSCLARAIPKRGRQAAGCVPYLVDKLPHNYSSRVMNHAF